MESLGQVGEMALTVNRLKRVEAISFDLDETLLDGSKFRDTVVQTCNQLAVATGLDANQLLEANGKAWESYWPQVEEKWTLGGLSGANLSLEVWRRTFLACGQDDEHLARLALETHTQNRGKTLRLFDDAQKAIDVLKLRFRLGLITNGASDTQRSRLRLLGIEKTFDAVIISGEVGVAKPDASVFALALQKLGVGKENVWHVGDSLKTDVAGAVGAGLTAVWLNRTGVLRKEDDPKPDHEIRSLSELARLLSTVS